MIIEHPRQDKLYIPLELQRLNQQGGKKESDVTFVGALKDFTADVNKMQIDANDASERFIKGEPVDIHDVMISAEKAKTSFQLLIELRNKGLDLYREVLRIQV